MRIRRKDLWMAATLLMIASVTQTAWAGPAPGPVNPLAGLLRLAGGLLFVLLWLICAAGDVALAYLASEFAPELFRRGRARLAVSPILASVVGLVNAFLLFVIVFALGATGRPPIQVLGVLMGLFLLFGLTASRALIYRAVGARLAGEVGPPDESGSAGAHFRGGAVVELACVVPILGWIAWLILSFATFGALIMTAFVRERIDTKETSKG